MIADYGEREIYPFLVQKEEGSMVIDSTEIIRNVVIDLIKGISTSKISGNSIKPSLGSSQRPARPFDPREN